MSLMLLRVGQTRVVPISGAPLTLTGTPTFAGAQAPTGNSAAFIVAQKLADWVCTGEVWRVIGMQLYTTTTTTVTPPVFQVAKNGTPITAGVTTASAVRTAPFSEYFAFASYAPGTDAAGDTWSAKNSVSASAGAAMAALHITEITVQGISTAVTTL
jgi:hypothetical protein